MIIEEPVQRLPHGGEISSTITSEPPTSDQHVDFGLAQLDPDAAQPFLTPVPVAAHPLGTGLARPGWRSRERRATPAVIASSNDRRRSSFLLFRL